jgi:hypothetical protein
VEIRKNMNMPINPIVIIFLEVIEIWLIIFSIILAIRNIKSGLPSGISCTLLGREYNQGT